LLTVNCWYDVTTPKERAELITASRYGTRVNPASKERGYSLEGKGAMDFAVDFWILLNPGFCLDTKILAAPASPPSLVYYA
jgi:hypothetical protein